MSAEADALDLETVRPLLRREYDQLVEAGAFEDEPIELIDGRLVVMSPEGAPHAAIISLLNRLLVLALDGRAHIRCGSPLAASDISEPEPDLAAIPPIDQWAGHPHTAHLVVEVSHSSLHKDTRVKPRLYAAAGVPEYWIVDVQRRAVIVLTEPGDAGYERSREYARGDRITLVTFPDVTFEVDAFLPE